MALRNQLKVARAEAGFTLIEVLVALAIFALLAALMIRETWCRPVTNEGD